MVTNSRLLALSKHSLEDRMKPELKVWMNIKKQDCRTIFSANPLNNISPRKCFMEHIQHNKRKPELFKEMFHLAELICLCSKTYCCFDQITGIMKFSTKRHNRRNLEGSGTGPLEKYKRVLEEKNECSVYELWIPNK